MNKIVFFVLSICFLVTAANAQVGIGTTSPDPSAALHISDSTRGILIPRMAAANRVAILNPAEGLMVYQTDAQKGYWYFNGTAWQQVASSVNGGKNLLILSNDITNVEAAQKIAEETGPNTQFVKIINCTNLTSVNLSGLTSLAEIIIENNTILQSVNLSSVEEIESGLIINKCPSLTSINLSGLKQIGQAPSGYAMTITENGLTGIDFPQLEKIWGGLMVRYNPAMLSVSFPSLREQYDGNMSFSGSGLNAFSAPSLIKAGGVWLQANFNLASVDLSSLTECQSLVVGQTNVLTSFSMPSLVKGGTFSISSMPNLLSLNVPQLETAGRMSFYLLDALPSISFPLLDTCTELSIDRSPALTGIYFPELDSLNFVRIKTNNSLIEVAFPSLLKLGDEADRGTQFIKDNANLTTINLGNVTTLIGDRWEFNNNKLNSAGVNSLLAKLAASNPVIRLAEILLYQSPSAPPTGQGLVDKAFLISNSNNVLTN